MKNALSGLMWLLLATLLLVCPSEWSLAILLWFVCIFECPSAISPLVLLQERRTMRTFMAQDRRRIQSGGTREKFAKAKDNCTRRFNKYWGKCILLQMSAEFYFVKVFKNTLTSTSKLQEKRFWVLSENVSAAVFFFSSQKGLPVIMETKPNN